MEDCFGEDAYEIMLTVDPPASGEIQINTLEVPFYPFNATYFTGVEIDLEATPIPGWDFDYWELNNHAVTPSSSMEEVILQLTTTDTIIAHFKETTLPIFPIHVEVYPAGSGTVTINTIEPVTYPWDGAYTSGTLINVTANPAAGYSFNYWDLYNQFVNPSPTDANAFFAIATGDTLVANFQSGTGLDAAGSPLTTAALLPAVSSGPTTLLFGLEDAADVDLALFNLSGSRLATLTPSTSFAPGQHSVTIDPAAYNLPAGMYLVVLQADGYRETLRWVVGY
jgi:hypothetical protein